MKGKWALLSLILLVVPSMVFGGPIQTDLKNTEGTVISSKVYDGEVIAANTAVSLPAKGIDFTKMTVDGYVGLQVEVTGSGTLECKAESSINKADYFVSASSTTILTGFTATSGPGSDGKGTYPVSFGFLPAAFKIRCEETGDSDPVTVNIWLVVQ